MSLAPFRYRGQEESLAKSASVYMNDARPFLARPSYTGTKKIDYKFNNTKRRDDLLRSSNDREEAKIESAARTTEGDVTAFRTEEVGLGFTGEDGTEAERVQSRILANHAIIIIPFFHPSPLPSPRVAKPKPDSDNMPAMT